ncbi:metallophosphoesterase family protein [Cohnella nanjingensis]|uniref:Metallophosphoesterase family protein n=1 Tax=Cohnella nanjingensis TaxID=1387779 RepID=A0A7X0RUS7_9BACL|nr:metallophosphoesterase family protein [Cohnella nanjingensis]MBB6672795.1 metallophosphoesterase family protein [Cohnella nanjingensis]
MTNRRAREPIAVISDIHSNAHALEAVLRDIDARGIGRIVCLGDSLFGPIDPIGTARLLMADPRIVHLMGNCDEVLLAPEGAGPTYRFVKPLLTEETERWMAGFPAVWSDGDWLFCHGTPDANDVYLLEEVGPRGASYKPSDRLRRELAHVRARVVFCGHSHVFALRHLPDGKTVVNAGSVGLPAYEDEEPIPHVMASGHPFAEYVIVREGPDGTNAGPRIEHLLVPYDWERAADIALRRGRPEYATALRTGRM